MLCHLCRSGSGLLALQSNPNFVWILYIDFHPTPPCLRTSPGPSPSPPSPANFAKPNSANFAKLLRREADSVCISQSTKATARSCIERIYHRTKDFREQGESVCCLILFRSYVKLWWFMSCRLEACTSTNQFAFKQKDSWNSLSCNCHIPAYENITISKQETSRTQVSHQQTVLFCGLAWN